MTGRLLALDVENFRSLRSVSVPLGELTVLVGPNGAGKSNVLKVFDFLADVIRTDLVPAFEERGGFDEIAFWGGDRPPSTMRIGIKALWTSHSSVSAPDEYELAVHRRTTVRRDAGYSLSRQERFQFKRTRGRGRRVTIRGERAEVADTAAHGDSAPSRQIGISKLSSGLSTLPRLGPLEGGAEVATVARRLSSFRVFDVDVARARRPSRTTERGVELDDDAGNLAAFLLDLSKDEGVWDDLIADARAVLPQLREITFAWEGGAARTTTVHLVEEGLRRPTPLADASYGTVRLLGLLALLHDPDPPALTCVEEIDHGLHPQALELLVERLREASARSQYIVATHSPALVDRLRPDEFVVCERAENGESRIPAVSLGELAEIVEQSEGLPLGELWFSGALGGDL